MQVRSETRISSRLPHLLFVVLFLTVIGLLAVVCNRMDFSVDWTTNGRQALRSASEFLLGRMVGEIRVSLFAKDGDPLRDPIVRFLERYRRYKPDFLVEVVNPETAPGRARAMNIHVADELVIEYQGRSERLLNPTEQTMANAFERLIRGGERVIVFLQGHGERETYGKANENFSIFADALQHKGLHVANLDLEASPQIPENAAMLVIAEPKRDLLPSEVAVIQDYLTQGGNLLWLAEPGSLHGLLPIAQSFGLELSPGVVVDVGATQLFAGACALGTQYDFSPITQGFARATLFPAAAAVLPRANAGDWRATPLVMSSEESGLEVADLNRAASEETRGPLPLAVALTRPSPVTARALVHTEHGAVGNEPRVRSVSPHREQRVVVFGGGAFLSDAFVGNGGNLDLGAKVVNWLVHDESLLNVPIHVAMDSSLRFSPTALFVIAGGFLVLFPLGFVAMAALVWWRRPRCVCPFEA